MLKDLFCFFVEGSFFSPVTDCINYDQIKSIFESFPANLPIFLILILFFMLDLWKKIQIVADFLANCQILISECINWSDYLS